MHIRLIFLMNVLEDDLYMVAHLLLRSFHQLIQLNCSQAIGQFSVLVGQQSFSISLSNTILLFDIGRFLEAIGELWQASDS